MGHGVTHDGMNEALFLVSMASYANLGANIIAVALGGRLCGLRCYRLAIILRQTSPEAEGYGASKHENV
jgi:hypothetical protein